MISLVATGFRYLFRIDFFKKKYFGLYKNVFLPTGLFNSISKQVTYQNDLTLQLRLADWIQQNIYFLGQYEEKEIAFLERYLKPGDVFVDVGANIGLHTLLAARRVGAAGRVYAFEPLGQNYQHLQKHLKINNIHNVVAEQAAVSDADGSIEFFSPPATNCGMGSRYNYSAELTDAQVVKAVALDTYAAGFSRIDVVKIDIEGGELLALQGMRNILMVHRPKILMEIEKRILGTASGSENQLLEFLYRFGYKKCSITPDGRLSAQPLEKAENNFVFVHESDLF